MNQEAVCWLKDEIKKRYGNVKRARGIYLYTEKSVRLTDCFLDGGRAILGHGGGKAKTAFKDCFERGANGFYDSGLLPAFEKSVKQLLPAEYNFIRLYSEKTATEILTLIQTLEKTQPVLWRPWLEITGKCIDKPTGYPDIKIEYNWKSDFPYIIKLVPPFPYATDICVYAFSKKLNDFEQSLPKNDIIPSALIAAYTRGFYDLKIALGKYCKNDFSAYSKQLEPYFTKNQCYLFSKLPETQYRDFVLKCLDVGIVISPDYREPSIIPWRANPGDIKKISNIV